MMGRIDIRYRVLFRNKLKINVGHFGHEILSVWVVRLDKNKVILITVPKYTLVEVNSQLNLDITYTLVLPICSS